MAELKFHYDAAAGAKKKKKKKAKLGGKFVIWFAVSQWIHQGFTYLDRTEMFYRVIWELVPDVAFFVLFYCSDLMSFWPSFILALFVVHTLNWVFNFNFWTGIDFSIPNFKNMGNERTIEYLRGVQNRMKKADCIGACTLYGSLSRAVWGEKSDLDMRIIRRPGILNGFKAYWVTFVERIIAVWYLNPMDLYMADGPKFLTRLRDDEFPIFLKLDDKRIFDYYDNNGIELEEVDFDTVGHLNELGHPVKQ